jgi:protein phosphatase
VEYLQGGIGPAGLSTDDLHVLDLTQAKPRWHRLVIYGSYRFEG